MEYIWGRTLAARYGNLIIPSLLQAKRGHFRDLAKFTGAGAGGSKMIFFGPPAEVQQISWGNDVIIPTISGDGLSTYILILSSECCFAAEIGLFQGKKVTFQGIFSRMAENRHFVASGHFHGP